MTKLQYRPFKGLEIRCLKCNKTIQRDSSPKGSCKHPVDKTVYRAIVIIPNSGGKRISRTLVSRNFEGAVKELIDFRMDVENGIPQYYLSEKEVKPQLIADCMAMFIDYLADIDVAEHEKKHNTQGYLNTQRSFYGKFLKFLESEKRNLDLFEVTHVNDKLLGNYHSFLLNNSKSNYTFNHNVKAMRALYQFLIVKRKYQIENPFKKIRLRAEKGKDITISSEDFFALLSVVSPENAIKQIGKTSRNMYKPWLTNAFKLKAYTGRRNEEIFMMRWSMVKFEGQTPIYIESPHQKINKLKNQFTSEELDFVYIPIIEELENLLVDLGMNEKRTSNDFIIAPGEMNRLTIEKQASKSFTFFFEKLNRDYTVQFSYLRSTYITANEIYALQQGPKLIQHADFRITSKHYINHKEIAKFISKDRGEKKFTVFKK